jgi:hypothetical protein
MFYNQFYDTSEVQLELHVENVEHVSDVEIASI